MINPKIKNFDFGALNANFCPFTSTYNGTCD